MAEGSWRCGMCAAHNEPSKDVCMVCDTFRVLGARGAYPAGGDLLASAQSMFEPPGEGPPPVPSPEEPDDPPQVRVMEPPPVRPGRARSGSEQPELERSGPERSGPERSGSEKPGPESAVVGRGAAQPSAGPWPDTERPAARGPTVEPPAPDHAPGPSAVGRRLSPAGWSLPRWPPGTVRAVALAVVGATVVVLVWALPEGEGGEGDGDGQSEACPERIAALVPGAGPGPLVESFETERHRIVLCANGAGELYYFGEFLDGRGETMVVPAERTAQGYVAEAGQTRYEIGGGAVVITGGDGEEIARLPVDSVPAPK